MRADLARIKQDEAAEKLQETLSARYRVEILAEELQKVVEEQAAPAQPDPGGAPTPPGGDPPSIPGGITM